MDKYFFETFGLFILILMILFLVVNGILGLIKCKSGNLDINGCYTEVRIRTYEN